MATSCGLCECKIKRVPTSEKSPAANRHLTSRAWISVPRYAYICVYLVMCIEYVQQLCFDRPLLHTRQHSAGGAGSLDGFGDIFGVPPRKTYMYDGG